MVGSIAITIKPQPNTSLSLGPVFNKLPVALSSRSYLGLAPPKEREAKKAELKKELEELQAYPFIIVNVQSNLFLRYGLLMGLLLIICIISSIPPENYLMSYLDVDPVYFELENTNGPSTHSYMESTGNNSSGEADPEGTSPTNSESSGDSESTGGLADLTEECERFKELYENAQERLKAAFERRDWVSAGEVSTEAEDTKKSYYTSLEKLNEEEDSHGYPRTDNQLNEPVRDYPSSDEEGFAASDDSRPVTPPEVNNNNKFVK